MNRPPATHRRALRGTLAPLAVALMLAACDRGAPGSETTRTPSAPAPTPASSPATPGGTVQEVELPELSGPCANAYLPVIAESTWSYHRTIGKRASRFEQRIERVRGDGFSVLVDFGEAGTREIWTCSPEGLARVETFETGPDGGPPPPGTVAFHQRRVRGVTVPSDPAVGSTWRQVVTSFGRFTVNGITHTEKQVVTSSFRVVREEPVTTPAGTFQALVVGTVTTTRKTAPTFGAGIDQRLENDYTQWWVRGIGLVRLVSANRPINTIELTGYRLG